MKRFKAIARFLVLLIPFLALIPIGRIASDWVEVSRIIAEPTVQADTHGFDWVLWAEDDGVITASYVFPEGPAAEAGIRQGDAFYMLEYQQYFNADDLMRAIEGIAPGSVRTFSVQRGGDFLETKVRIRRYPTFLYPLSSTLWNFSIWGFTIGAFIHVVGLTIAGPLALRSRKARSSLLLIFVSSLWIFANLLRLMAFESFGPPDVGSTYSTICQALTVVGLAGWIGFPALLLHKMTHDTRVASGRLYQLIRFVIYVPLIVLGAAALGAGLLGRIGPITLHSLTTPILFYVCCYIAAAAALVFLLYFFAPDEAERRVGGWGRTGSLFTILATSVAALSVLGVVPLLGSMTDTTVGWLIVSAQLLAVVPVLLVSLATLKYGKVNLVLSRALTYVTVLGLIFFAFVGGMALLEPLLARTDLSFNVVAGLYVVFLLVVFERLARRLRVYAAAFFATERQRTRQSLSHFQERMRDILDLDALTQQTVQVAGEAFRARSAVLFLRPVQKADAAPSPPHADSWISSSYHPEPPFFTKRVFHHLWPHLKQDSRIWARNAELNESDLPPEQDRLLRKYRSALAVPIQGDREPIGLLVLGPKKQRRAVYNLEDLDLLRSLSGQLALAVERLSLVEREKALARETTQAELVALRAQINPHFLFNALNTIIALIEERPQEAEATVEHLSAIFRHILQAGSQPFLPLEDEFKLVQHYLQIEQARFGSRLQVTCSLPSELETHPVPAFSVQTLVENAVKHGLAGQRQGGRVTLEARALSDSGAEVIVSDTGTGIPALFDQDEEEPPDSSFFGMGLTNVDARLRQLYGREDLIQISSSPDEGTTVRLRLPCDRSEAFGRDTSDATPQNKRGGVTV